MVDSRTVRKRREEEPECAKAVPRYEGVGRRYEEPLEWKEQDKRMDTMVVGPS